MSSNIHVAMKSINTGTRMPLYAVLHGTPQIPVGKAQNQAQNELKQTCKRHQAKATYVNTAAQITLVKVYNRAHNELIRMLMYGVLHGTAQIPVGKAQNQAQNELNRTCLGHQGLCSM